MVQAPVKTLPLEAFLQMPETKPASEFINGQITQKPMPKGKHSRLQLSLSIAINGVLEGQKVALALPEIRCTFDGLSIVPDIGVFRWSRIPLDDDGDIANDFNSHPDWLIEVVSPKQSSTKVITKILHSLEHGTEMGWLIDPASRLVMVYPKGKQPQAFAPGSSSGQLPVPSFASNVGLTAEDVFSWLKI